MIKPKGNIPILLVLVAIITIGAGFLFINNSAIVPEQNSVPSSSPKPANETTKNFESEAMKFSIEILLDFKVNEKITFVELEKNQQIAIISRNGTNFDDITTYVQDFDKKRIGLEIESEKLLKINGLNSLSRIEKFSAGSIEEQKIFYIYTETGV